MNMLSPTSYSNRFQTKEEVAAYDTSEYKPDSYSSFIWELQRPCLERLLQSYQAAHPRPLSLLDFACGTGRVLSAVEPFASTVHGVDISAEMVAVAHTRCPKAALRVGNIQTQPDLLGTNYDLITLFRFLLNVEPEIRRATLVRLRQAMRAPEGRLIVNVHGNSHSLRQPAILWKRLKERVHPTRTMLNTMSPAQARRLLNQSGFEVVEQLGFGWLPPTLHRTPLRRLARALDRRLAGRHWWNGAAIDLMFVCRPI